jgi:hypothetical protein
MEMQELIDEIREETREFTLGGEFTIDKKHNHLAYSLVEHSTGAALELMVGVIKKHGFSWYIVSNELIIHG